MSVYLDNSATTKPCCECVDAVNDMLLNNYGNPSSLHSLGISAMKEVILARLAIADSLGVQSDEIVFTSGATEANNMAIFGAVKAKKRRGKRIVTTAVEHESVLESVKQLEKEGFEVIYLKPDKNGNISENQIYEAVNKDTILVSIMYINNETGAIFPVKAIKNAVERVGSPALIHIDCVQAYGKYEVNPKKLGADLVSVTAHKIHGPKGTGALYINKNAHLTDQNFARTFGGEQERRIRPGTECSPLIAGFGAAVKAFSDIKKQTDEVKKLNLFARNELKKIDGIILTSDENASPYIINLYVPSFMRSQTIVQDLSAKYGVFVSSGSACARGKKSHVLTALALPDEIIDKSIRLSFSRYNTKEDVNILCNALKDIIKDYPLK